MKNYGFGSLWGIPLGTNPTPIRFATLKGLSLEVGGELDPLRGEKFWAVDMGKKNGKAIGKIDVAEINGAAISQILPGVTKTTGTRRAVVEFAATVPTTPFQVTVVPPSSGVFVEDLGVIDSSTGLQMTRGATATGAGVYAVSVAGVYTFNTADATKAVRISYAYSVAASGSTYTLDNSVMGLSTGFVLNAYNSTGGLGARLNSVHIPKLAFNFKPDGWTEFGLEYEAVTDTTGSIGKIFSDDV